MRAVLDTSALLAFIKGEAGQDVVRGVLAHAPVASVVTLAELAAVLIRKGLPMGESRSVIGALPVVWLDADADLAMRTGEMIHVTRPFGLSLGDRFCLALGMREGGPVYTADRAWAKIAAPLGVAVSLVR